MMRFLTSNPAPPDCINSDDIYLSFYLLKMGSNVRVLLNNYINGCKIYWQTETGTNNTSLHNLIPKPTDKHRSCIGYLKQQTWGGILTMNKFSIFKWAKESYNVLLLIGLLLNFHQNMIEQYMGFTLRDEHIIVTFSTTPNRINEIEPTVKTILKQNIKVDGIYISYSLYIQTRQYSV